MPLRRPGRVLRSRDQPQHPVLAGLVVGRLVAGKPTAAARVAVLDMDRAAGMQNLATGMQYIGLMAMVEDQIVECFRHGGGVPYSAFPRFQAVMAEDSGAVHDATLIEGTLPLDEWVALGEAATRGLPRQPTASEILAADRGRLERR